MAGAVIESDNYGFAEDFISSAAAQLQPGMAAVIAEIEEDDPVFVTSSLTPLGAVLTRSDVDYEYDKHSDEEIDELDEEVAAARAKLKSATDKEKSKIQQKIAKLKEERKEKIGEFKEKLQDAMADVKASVKDRKIGKLRSKIEKHQQKIADLEKQLQAVVEKGREAVKGTEAVS
jgi:DNA repair exonuclease SbcCD ATPase subunit